MLGQQHYKPKYNGRLCYTQPPIYVEKNMIYDSTKELLSITIKEYDKLAGKEFLIGCSISKNHDTEYMVLQINRHNFWHLLGCQLDKSKLKERSLDIYDMCIKGEEMRVELSATIMIRIQRIRIHISQKPHRIKPIRVLTMTIKGFFLF